MNNWRNDYYDHWSPAAFGRPGPGDPARLGPAPTAAEQVVINEAVKLLRAEEKKNMGQYIVWNPASNLPSKVVHENRPTAIRVAGRMANENPGETFYVCKLVNKASKPANPSVAYEDQDKA